MSGKPYLPSNGTEGMSFIEHFCARCTRETYNPETGKGRRCRILTESFFAEPGNGPVEWQYDENDRATCTAFDDRSKKKKKKKNPPRSRRDKVTRNLF